jgi:hypothetical protein
MSNSAVIVQTMFAVRAINAAQDPDAVPFFARTRRSPLTTNTHIGCSTVCQTKEKRFYTVPVQYRPSCRAEDQEAGPVGAGGAWPVRPAALAAAPGKHLVCYVWHIVCYDIVCFRRCEPTTSEPYIRYRIIPMLHYTSYATSSKNVRCHMLCRTYDWQEPVKNVRYRTFFYRCRTLYMRCRIKNIRCRIRHRIRYFTYDWQEPVF